MKDSFFFSLNLFKTRVFFRSKQVIGKKEFIHQTSLRTDSCWLLRAKQFFKISLHSYLGFDCSLFLESGMPGILWCILLLFQMFHTVTLPFSSIYKSFLIFVYKFWFSPSIVFYFSPNFCLLQRSQPLLKVVSHFQYATIFSVLRRSKPTVQRWWPFPAGGDFSFSKNDLSKTSVLLVST